jgi:hypothetical protein
MKKVVEYFKILISTSGEASSKRFISLYCLVLLTAVVVCSLFKITIQDNVVYTLGGLIGGASLMTLFQKKDDSDAGK